MHVLYIVTIVYIIGFFFQAVIWGALQNAKTSIYDNPTLSDFVGFVFPWPLWLVRGFIRALIKGVRDHWRK